LSNSEDFETTSLSIGTHIIKYKVKDEENFWSDYEQKTLVINPQIIQNEKPTAEIIIIKPNEVYFMESVYFHGIGMDSNGIIIEFRWRSNKDGIISTKPSFTRSNLSIGIHIIYFKVKNDHGEWSDEDSCKLIINSNIQKENNPPIAKANGPYLAYKNKSISFDASKSYDPDGDIVVSYRWDFGDGTNGEGVIIDHLYNKSNNYSVKLTIRDDQGKKSTIHTYANILEQPSIKNIIEKDNDKTKQIPGFNISFIIIAILIFLLKKNRILKKY